MRALVQRVTSAAVRVGDETLGAIGRGLCVFVGVTHDDDPARAERLAQRLAGLRILADADGVANLSLRESGGDILVVSQFSLYADTTRGRRPSYVAAARPEQAAPLIEVLVAALRAESFVVETGRFGATMAVELVNDGPFTVLLEV